MNEIEEAVDWQGAKVECAGCAHVGLNAEERCRLKHACVRDRYARRIDRFFDWNAALANDYLTHPHFEVRAIAAKHASVFRLPSLLDDPDETVRWNAARRVPKRLILKLRNDPHREVRIRIVSLLDDVELQTMMSDNDYYVRLVVARRIAPSFLAWMIDDAEAEVRRVVARRIPKEWLLRLAYDRDPVVRVEIAQRLPPGLLSRMRNDLDWRYEVASRIPVKELADLIDDPDDFVQEMAKSRRTDEPSRLEEAPR